MALLEECIALLDTISALTDSDGPRNFADWAPDGVKFPYTELRLDISESPALRGDGRTLAITRLGQLDLWERIEDQSEALRLAIWSTLDGVELADTFKIAIRGVVRVPDPNFKIAHRAFTFAAIQRVAA